MAEGGSGTSGVGSAAARPQRALSAPSPPRRALLGGYTCGRPNPPPPPPPRSPRAARPRTHRDSRPMLPATRRSAPRPGGGQRSGAPRPHGVQRAPALRGERGSSTDRHQSAANENRMCWRRARKEGAGRRKWRLPHSATPRLEAARRGLRLEWPWPVFAGKPQGLASWCDGVGPQARSTLSEATEQACARSSPW